MQPLKEVASDIDVVAAAATATIVVLSVVVVVVATAVVVVVTKFSLILQKALFHGAKSSVRTIVVVQCGANSGGKRRNLSSYQALVRLKTGKRRSLASSTFAQNCEALVRNMKQCSPFENLSNHAESYLMIHLFKNILC